MKASLPSWLVGGGEALFVFCEVFGEALAFGGDVDLAFVDDGDVEVGGGAGVGAGERFGGELNGGYAGHAGEHVLICVGQGDDAVPAWRWMGVDSFSGTPSSLRRARMVVMRSCRVVIAAAAMGSAGKSVGCG